MGSEPNPARALLSGPTDLTEPSGDGPVWGLASEDLNATLLSWSAGDGVAEHVNSERDVLIIPKRSCRRIVAGTEGLRYLSVHLRRGPLQIEGASDRG